MATTYLTIPEDRLEDVAPEVRRTLEDGADLDDAALKELRRVGQYEANPLEYLGWIGTSGWYLDAAGRSHYVRVAPRPDEAAHNPNTTEARP